MDIIINRQTQSMQFSKKDVVIVEDIYSKC